MADGAVAVLNMGSHQVRVFGADGAWIRDLGGKGDGPGEFQFPIWIGSRGDTLIVWDSFARRATRFRSDGTVLETGRVPQGAGLFPRAIGAYADGSLLLAVDAVASHPFERAGIRRDSSLVLRVSSAGELMDTLVVVPGAEQFVSATSGGQGAKVEDLPFGRRTEMTLHADLLYVGTGEDARVRVVDREGRIRDLLSVPGPPVEIGASDIEQYWKNLVTIGGRGGDEREPPEGIRYPRTLPPHGPLHLDAHGRIWIAEPVLPRQWDHPTRWWIFSPAAEMVATIQLPPRSLVLQIGDDWLLLRQLDADQREIVSMYRFSPHRR